MYNILQTFTRKKSQFNKTDIQGFHVLIILQLHVYSLHCKVAFMRYIIIGILIEIALNSP